MEIKDKSFPKEISVVFVQSKAFPDGIQEAFELILSKPDSDPNGRCIELYDYFGSDSFECIVRKAD